MNLFTGESSDAFFGGEVPPLVRRLLDQARTATPKEMEALLWTAHASAPTCLPVYYLLYKFHARQRQFEMAEKAAQRGIIAAARQAGLAEDWRQVGAGDADFNATGPARFWLFCLKALAFIYLRCNRGVQSGELVVKIGELDPSHGLGGDVISALLQGSQTELPNS